MAMAVLQERNGCPNEACLALAYLDRLRTSSQGSESAPQPAATTDADLLKQVDELKSNCRGGAGDNAATMAACEQREVIVSTLKERGRCWRAGECGRVSEELAKL